MDRIANTSTDARAYPVGETTLVTVSRIVSDLERAAAVISDRACGPTLNELHEAQKLMQAAMRKAFVLKVEAQNRLRGSAMGFGAVQGKAVADA